MRKAWRHWLLIGLAAIAAVGLISCEGEEGGTTTQQEPTPTPTALPTPQTAAAVPERFQALYAELNSELAAIVRTLPEPSAQSKTAFGAELLAANGNAGQALLLPQAMTSVRFYLDQMQALGVQGVSVQISDPLLMPDFPRSSEYLEFYKNVAAEVRRRGLLLMVESGPVFSGTDYSNVDVGGRWRDKEQYFRDRRVQLEIIAREIRPDFLSLGNEPDTERMLTRLSFSLDDYIAFLRETISVVRVPGGPRLGAGTGSWDDPQYVTRFVDELPLDFIDLHIYPLTNGKQDYIGRLIELSRLAKSRGRDIVIGEAWLYKASASEVQARIPYGEVYGRDYYSFWAPLDALYVDMVGRLAQREGISFVSFFWSKYLFGYLSYEDATSRLPATELIRLSNRAAVQAMSQGDVSPAGRALRRLTSGR